MVKYKDSDPEKWMIKEHTKVKHDILSLYLVPWARILRSFNKRLIILDGFAGRGEYTENGQKIVCGSPIIFMDLNLTNLIEDLVCIYVEKDQDNYSNLCDVLKQRKKGESSRCKGDEIKYPRNVKVIDNLNFHIDSIEVNTIPIDHSLPGVCGFIFHTSNGSIAYTADIRYHGRRRKDTEKFVEDCSQSEIDTLLCEGTRVDEDFSKTEIDVEKEITDIVNKTNNLVVCSYPTRDLDRLLSFYNAAIFSGRYLVIDLKQAYILKLFQSFDSGKIYPKPTDKWIKVYIPKKKWGLIDKDLTQWGKKLVLEDYFSWAGEFLDLENRVDYRDVIQKQNEMIFYCSDFQVQELIDIRPKENSSYIRSSTEPFDDEMELDQKRVKRWLIHFGLIKKEDEWNHIHVSGHGSGDQIRKIIEGSNSKRLIPIHTQHEEYHKKWHPNVHQVQINESLSI